MVFKGQSAAQMVIIVTLYIQQALASILEQLNLDSPNLDSMTQTVRNSFAMSSKGFDQIGRTGAFHHFISQKATINNMGLDNIKDVARHVDSLPLMGDGVLGIDSKSKLRERTEKNKDHKDLIPDVSVKQSLAPKRKATFTTNIHKQKQMRFDNNRKYRSYGQNRPEYSTPRKGNSYKSAGCNGQRFSNQQKKGVSSF